MALKAGITFAKPRAPSPQTYYLENCLPSRHTLPGVRCPQRVPRGPRLIGIPYPATANGASEQSCPQEWHHGKGQWDQSPVPRLMPAHTLQQGKAAHAFWEYHLCRRQTNMASSNLASNPTSIWMPTPSPTLVPELPSVPATLTPLRRPDPVATQIREWLRTRVPRTQTSPASPDAA